MNLRHHHTDSGGPPASIDEIHDGVAEQAGVAVRIVTNDEFARFELAEAHGGHHHHHLICSSCGAVEDFTLSSGVEATIVRELEELAHRHGFVPSEHQVDLVGLCADCQ